LAMWPFLQQLRRDVGRSSQPARRPRRYRPCLESLEDRLSPAQLVVLNAADPAALTAGTLRFAVNQANADGANGISDTIVFDTAKMGTGTVTLKQGLLELNSPVGMTIDGGGTVHISGNNQSSVFQVDSTGGATLTGLTIENGNAMLNRVPAFGGG